MSNEKTKSWLEDNATPSAPSVSFLTVGDAVVGKVIGASVVTGKEMNDPNKEVDNYVIQIELQKVAGTPKTSVKNEAGVASYADLVIGETYSIWIKPKSKGARALGEALSAAGAKDIEADGLLAWQYVSDGPREPGKNPPKVWGGQYKAPERAAAVASVVGLLA